MSNPDLPPNALQKPTPRALLKPLAKKADRIGSDHVKARSGGRCEVVFVEGNTAREETLWFAATGEHPRGRCIRNAVHVHHMISGRGKRGIGRSALPKHKQHVCEQCHRDIHGDIGGRRLERVGGVVPHWTDPYRRVR